MNQIKQVELEKLINNHVINSAMQKHIIELLNSHRQQLIKEVRLAIEGKKSRSLSHACLESWGGCDCGLNNKLIDDILALEVLQEEK